MKQPGKRVQLFGGLETSFKTPPSIAASHFLRHVSASVDFDPKNKRPTPEKKAGPGRYVRFDDRETAGFSVEALLRMSGTLNTLPEASALLEAAMGDKNNITLATTVNTTTAVGGATLASVTGLVANKTGVQITCPDGKLRLRRIATISGMDVTWTPELPTGQNPANGAAIKAVNCYFLTAALAKTLWFARYAFEADLTAGMDELVKGGVAERLSITCGFNDEPRISVNGPAATKTAAAAHPGSATQVGTNPASGNDSEIYVDNVLARFKKFSLEMTNGMELRIDENNATVATEAYRIGDRDVSVGFDADAENDYASAHYDKAMAATELGVLLQIGLTASGKLFAVHLPRVEMKAPTANVGDSAIELPFKGMGLETVEDANDEFVVMLG